MEDISAVSDKIGKDMNSISKQMTGGKVPVKFAGPLAELKGKFPNPKTLKSVFKPGATINKEFLKDFDPTTDLITNLGIPAVKIDIPEIQFKPSEPKIEPEVDTTGLTDKEIAAAKAKRAARQKLNDKAAS